MTPKLEIQGLSKWFGDLEVLRDIEFQNPGARIPCHRRTFGLRKDDAAEDDRRHRKC